MADALGIKIGDETRMFQDQVARAAANQAAQDASTALANANAASQRVTTAEQNLGAQIDDTQQVLEQQIDATEQGLQTQINTVNSDLDTKITDLQTKIDELEQKIANIQFVAEEELWKNTGSLTSYSSGNFTIPAGYDKYIFEYIYDGADPGITARVEFKIISNSLSYFPILNGASWDTDGDYYMANREFSTTVSGNNVNVSISRAYYASLYADDNGKIARSDSYIIPYRILGVKNG